MSAYSENVKRYIELYRKEHGNDDSLIDTHDIAAWAYKKGLHKPNTKTIIDIIASDIAKVFREEYRTDPNGRRYRAKHAVKTVRNNKQYTLWADMDDPNVPHAHFQKSFAQRRQQIIGDCYQLKTDIDVYNSKRSNEEPIQIVLDFTYDIEELEYVRNKKIA